MDKMITISGDPNVEQYVWKTGHPHGILRYYPF